MKGYWHIPAIASAIAMISIVLERNLIIFLFLWLVFLYMDHRMKLAPFLISIVCFLFFLHYLPDIDNDSSIYDQYDETRKVQGKIVEAPTIQENKVEVVLEDLILSEKILLIHFPDDGRSDGQDAEHLRLGAVCEVEGQLESPEGARNPGEFDYRQFLLTRDIKRQMVIDHLEDIRCEGASFWHRFFYLRHQLIQAAKLSVSDETAAWMNALVLGDDSSLDDRIVTLFQDWGLSHILAISGLHIGIVIGLIYFLLIKTNVMTKEKTELVVLLFLPVYALLAGAEPSVLRASLMVFIVLLLRRMNVNIPTLDAISIVFILLVILNPFMMYHVGFQFSFFVTFAILLSRKWLSSVSPGYQVLIISFISQMAILPLQLNYFYLFQPLSILLNLIIVPYFSIFVIPFLFLFHIFSFLPDSFLQFFDKLFISVHRKVIHFIEWIDYHFNYPFYMSGLPLWFLGLYYLFLWVALYFIERKRRNEAFVSFTTIAFLLMAYALIPYVSDEGAVTMLDIGQGDAFIIELPYRRGVFMIDAGAKFSFEDRQATASNYERIIKPYLRSKGIHHIDALFLTHEDIDHMGSLPFMLEDGIVKTIYVSNYFIFPDDLSEKMDEGKIPVYRVAARDVIDVNGQLFAVLAPLQDKNSANENSLVLYTEIGGKSWLFTGDIGKDEELEIVRTFDFQADVVKIAHHGSRTSSAESFLQEIASDTALIPVGKNNVYGHPAKEVMETLDILGIDVFRTDEHGAVQYIFNKEKGSFHPFLGN